MSFMGAHTVLFGLSQYDNVFILPGCIPYPEESYGEDIPGMTVDEFQAWSDGIIKESQSE
jgi:hypothetical protein